MLFARRVAWGIVIAWLIFATLLANWTIRCADWVALYFFKNPHGIPHWLDFVLTWVFMPVAAVFDIVVTLIRMMAGA